MLSFCSEQVYEGSWFRGQPVAPFVSRTGNRSAGSLVLVSSFRCFGSGAISCGLKVGYGTARAEVHRLR